MHNWQHFIQELFDCLLGVAIFRTWLPAKILILFVKSSPSWALAEAMDVFKELPQGPHFFPLQEWLAILMCIQGPHFFPLLEWLAILMCIQRLYKDGLLCSFDFESFDTCESCLLGKMTKTPFTDQSERLSYLLRLLHTDVCGPLSSVVRGDFQYFITFTDDFSRHRDI
jgi:hypothetical protein